MAATTGITPDLTETVTVPKKATVPVGVINPPKLGQVWPRGAKNTAS